MWKWITSIYLTISGIMATWVIGKELSYYTDKGWLTTILTWLIMVVISLPCFVYYLIRIHITEDK